MIIDLGLTKSQVRPRIQAKNLSLEEQKQMWRIDRFEAFSSRRQHIWDQELAIRFNSYPGWKRSRNNAGIWNTAEARGEP
jgi:hypothetical protein